MADLRTLQEQLRSMAASIGMDWLQSQVSSMLGASSSAPADALAQRTRGAFPQSSLNLRLPHELSAIQGAQTWTPQPSRFSLHWLAPVHALGGIPIAGGALRMGT